MPSPRPPVRPRRTSEVVVHFDGACQPPQGGGVAAFGFTVRGAGIEHNDCGAAVEPGSPEATNNVAEYLGAIRALEYLRGQGYRGPVQVYGDSALVIGQVTGKFKVRAEHLRPYRDRVLALAAEFERASFEWVPRSENRMADALSKQGVRMGELQRVRARPLRRRSRR